MLMPERLSDFTGDVNPKSVEIGGIKFVLREFDMRTRALWMDVAEKYNLNKLQHEIQSKVIPKISNLSTDIENDPRLRSAAARLDKLRLKHDELMDLYASKNEPENIDTLLNDLVIRMESVRDEVEGLTVSIQDEVMIDAKAAEEAIASFMLAQDRARVEFAHSLAVAMGKTALDFDEFFARCGGSDYEAAEKLVMEGNARWASLYNSRLQRKPAPSRVTN
jgi:hypothetical protein